MLSIMDLQWLAQNLFFVVFLLRIMEPKVYLEARQEKISEGEWGDADKRNKTDPQKKSAQEMLTSTL